MSNADKLREFFAKVKKFPVGCNAELTKASGVKKTAIRYTIRDFLKRGEMRIENNMYVYVPQKRKESLADRIWKAWRYTPIWTIDEIAKLTGADRDTIRSYVWQYKKSGFVEQISLRRGVSGMEGMYRLKDKRRERPCLPKRRLKRREKSF